MQRGQETMDKLKPERFRLNIRKYFFPEGKTVQQWNMLPRGSAVLIFWGFFPSVFKTRTELDKTLSNLVRPQADTHTPPLFWPWGWAIDLPRSLPNLSCPVNTVQILQSSLLWSFVYARHLCDIFQQIQFVIDSVLTKLPLLEKNKI